MKHSCCFGNVAAARLWVILAGLATLGMAHTSAAAPNPWEQVLDFDAAVAGTVQDANGLGTGLTHRLLGTGQGLPERDPNLELDAAAGVLRIRSTNSDLNGQSGLGTGEYLGTRLADLGFTGTEDFLVTATFSDVRYEESYDQVGLFVGSASDANFRVIALFGYPAWDRFLFAVRNQYGGDGDSTYSTAMAPQPGDRFSLTIDRIQGQYHTAITNLTRPERSGALEIIQPRVLDGKSDLYVGILAANANNPRAKTAVVDSYAARVLCAPPVIRLLSRRAIWREGMPGQLQAEVESAREPQLQWFQNGQPIKGGANAVLILPSVTRLDEGLYLLVASNVWGAATSAPIVAVVSNVDPERFVALQWAGRAEGGLTLESTDLLRPGAVWQTLSNYPPATAEQRFIELAPAAAGFYRLVASGPGPVPAPVFTGAGFVNGWVLEAAVGSQHRIEYVTSATGWTNWQTLTNLVLLVSPYLFLDHDSLGAPERVYRTD